MSKTTLEKMQGISTGAKYSLKGIKALIRELQISPYYKYVADNRLPEEPYGDGS